MRELAKQFIKFMGYEDNIVVKDVMDEFVWWYENERDEQKEVR